MENAVVFDKILNRGNIYLYILANLWPEYTYTTYKKKKTNSLLAEIENPDGLELGLQLLAGGTARLVDEKEYRLSGDFGLVEALPQTPPFVQPSEAVARIFVGRDHAPEHVIRQSDEFRRTQQTTRITHI